MNRFLSLSLVAGLFLAGCSDPALVARVDALEEAHAQDQQKVQALEQKVEQLAARPATGAAAAPVVDEQAADGVARQATEAARQGDMDHVKELCQQLNTTYRGSQAQRSMRKVCEEARIIGIDAGQLDGIEQWYQGSASMDDGQATLLVFFESWCPHCRHEVPNLQETYTTYHDRGLNIVGLTRVTKSATDESVRDLLSENGVTYPVAKEDGSLATRFAVRGIPAAAMVKGGKVVWRGHPAHLTPEMIEGFLQ